MPRGTRRALRWKGFAITVEVPDVAARRLRRLRNRTERSPALPADAIEFMDPLPSVDPKRRDPVKALDMIRVPPGHEAPAWAPRMKSVPPGSEALASQVQAMSWYHTIELPGGVVTPGEYEHR